jgi:hypothetical protein
MRFNGIKNSYADHRDSMAQPSLLDTFQSKYEEFARELAATFPELEGAVKAALAIEKADRPTVYTARVLKVKKGLPSSTTEKAPGQVLPGVEVTQELWDQVSDTTKKAVLEYVSILSLCVAFQDGLAGSFSKEWIDKMMKDAQESMNKLDFESISQTFFKAFGGDGPNGTKMPPLPERFLKGKLAKLAEDLVREFKPEDFGLSAEEMAACESNPQRAFEILMKASMGNPQTIQRAMMRVAKKLQEKVNLGQLKPQELAAEAEELMKEFESHPAFVELMKTFRGAFGADDMEMARAQGRENEGRLAAIQQRLRKKTEAKKAAKGAAPAVVAAAALTAEPEDEEFASIRPVPKNKRR